MATLNQNIAIYLLRMDWIKKLTESWPLTHTGIQVETKDIQMSGQVLKESTYF